MYKKRLQRRAPARKRANKKKVYRAKTVSQAVKTYVKRTIHSSIENKSVQINNGSSFGNVNESPEFNAFPMCPLAGYWAIGQGVGQGSRIGNTIKTRKVFLNYVLRPTAYDVTFNNTPRPCEVQLMLGYVKSTPATIPVALDITNIFQSGSSVVAPLGTLRDIISVVNTDYWAIKKRWTHKIGYAHANGTGANPGNQYFSNNDFKYNAVRRMDITSHIPATHTFNDASVSTTSKNLFFMYYAVSADGTAFTATTLPANIEFWVDFHYEDA